MYPRRRPIDDLRAHPCPPVVRATVPDRLSERPTSALSTPRGLDELGPFRRDATGGGLQHAQQDERCAYEDRRTEEQAAIDLDERHEACFLDRQVITGHLFRQSIALVMTL